MHPKSIRIRNTMEDETFKKSVAIIFLLAMSILALTAACDLFNFQRAVDCSAPMGDLTPCNRL